MARFRSPRTLFSAAATVVLAASCGGRSSLLITSSLERSDGAAGFDLDGAGGMLSCGACTLPAVCGGGGAPNRCGCRPTTCAALGATCGTALDGCGGTISCGGCPAGLTCGGGGPNGCGTNRCVPGTCLS